LTKISESCNRTYCRIEEEETKVDKEGGQFSYSSNIGATDISDKSRLGDTYMDDSDEIYSFKRILIQAQTNRNVSDGGVHDEKGSRRSLKVITSSDTEIRIVFSIDRKAEALAHISVEFSNATGKVLTQMMWMAAVRKVSFEGTREFIANIELGT